jgi:hypothetical protein
MTVFSLLFWFGLFFPWIIKAKASNPYDQGCFHGKQFSGKKQRVCNSDDPPEAAELGHCRMSDFDYKEIRIFGMNWATAVGEAWILQILLSELLDVPTTIETGSADAKLNFYDSTASVQYGDTSNWLPSLSRGFELQDCRFASRNASDYEPCSHINPEHWPGGGSDHTVIDMVVQGEVKPPHSLGSSAYNAWFVPKFTGESDPSLLSFVGLQGEANRRKLAKTFLRPTTWKDYCDLVSPNQCQTDDDVALRSPSDETEGNRLFAEGFYKGHFRKTDRNDCDKNPTTCTGHIGDYPCGWNSYVQTVTHHLNISLESDGDEPYSGGYTRGNLVDMWRAANATKSNLMMLWWTPDTLYEEFMGTDAEFTHVLLPPPTIECTEARSLVDITDRCTANATTDADNICDYNPTILSKVFVRENITSDILPEVERSPAFSAMETFSMSYQQQLDLLSYIAENDTPREAVCLWAVDNYDHLLSFVPESYPRELSTEFHPTSLYYIAMALGGFSVFFVCWTSLAVFVRRKRRVMVLAQVEFMYLILLGSLSISIGAIVVASPPIPSTCMVEIWLTTLGYSLIFVPLIVKVAAINRLMHASRKMKRIVLTRNSLFGAVLAIGAALVLFLLLWTFLDPPLVGLEYEQIQRSSTTNNDESTTVFVGNQYCKQGENRAWSFVDTGWHILVLLCASILAVQSRNVKQEFNESLTLACLIYKSLAFTLAHFVVILLSGTVSVTILIPLDSMLWSLDAIAGLVIYFIPKLFTEDSGASLLNVIPRNHVSTVSSKSVIK